MTRDALAALIDAAYMKRVDDARQRRTPSQNTPFQPEYRRPPRGANPEKWGRTPYPDPTGDQATRNPRRKKR